MFIKNLSLKNFRNYENEVFDFKSGINVLVGDNAQGKTNCAEAVFYLCTGYSPRAGKDKQVIRYGEKSASIVGSCQSRYGKVEVSIEFTVSQKNIALNGVPIKKIGELMGNINSVFFNPGELKLIQQSPEDRRRFLYISLSQMDRSYFYSLQKYRKILEQRNDLLKNPDREVVYETLPLWDSELSSVAIEIINKRKEFISKLIPHAKNFHYYVTGGEELELSLETPYFSGTTKEDLITAFSEKTEKDLVLGYTTVGPHRDDIKIKIGGEDVRVYGSQGQQRTTAISLKLAELEVFNERFNEYPILILDDALSELDSKRRLKLIEKLKGFQTIITLTDLPLELQNLGDINVIKVSGGKIKN